MKNVHVFVNGSGPGRRRPWWKRSAVSAILARRLEPAGAWTMKALNVTRTLVGAALAFCAMATAHAETSRELEAARARLAAALPGAARSSYAGSVERTWLANGVDIQVFDQEKRGNGDPEESRRFPMLTFFGSIDRPAVYLMITKTQVLEGAKQKGFRSVRFFDRGANGAYTFDLSGAAIPNCDIRNRLCR